MWFHSMSIYLKKINYFFGSNCLQTLFVKGLYKCFLGGGNSNIFYFHPWGFMIQFDLRIFFKWVGKNHQLDYHVLLTTCKYNDASAC